MKRRALVIAAALGAIARAASQACGACVEDKVAATYGPLAAMSFAVNPRVRSPQGAVETAQRGMAAGTRLRIVRLQWPTIRSI